MPVLRFHEWVISNTQLIKNSDETIISLWWRIV